MLDCCPWSSEKWDSQWELGRCAHHLLTKNYGSDSPGFCPFKAVSAEPIIKCLFNMLSAQWVIQPRKSFHPLWFQIPFLGSCIALLSATMKTHLRQTPSLYREYVSLGSHFLEGLARVCVRAKPLTAQPGSKRRNLRCLGCHGPLSGMCLLPTPSGVTLETQPFTHRPVGGIQDPSPIRELDSSSLRCSYNFLYNSFSPLGYQKVTCCSPADSLSYKSVKVSPSSWKNLEGNTHTQFPRNRPSFWWVMTFKNKTH